MEARNILRGQEANRLTKYIIRGHGAINPGKKFTVGNSQYVIFPVKCGVSSNTMASTNIRVKKFMINPSLVYNIMSGKETNIPETVKNMRIFGPGNSVTNSYLELMNNTRVPSNSERNQLHQWYNKTSGLLEYKPTIRKFIYQSGHGTKQYLSNIISGKPGVFYVDACRVPPGTTQQKSNENIRKTRAGIPIAVPPKIKKLQIAEAEQLGMRPPKTYRLLGGSGLYTRTSKLPKEATITSRLLKRGQLPGHVLSVRHGRV